MTFEEFLSLQQKKDYYIKLQQFIETDSLEFDIYPPPEERFRAFELTPLEKTRVVIIGQDPYHQKGQAHGLAFSVNSGVKLPPSLRNIFKELLDDVGIKNQSGSLINWAKQGVLLVNTTLSVRDSMPMSHANKGWEIFFKNYLVELNKVDRSLIFVLWGRHAGQFETLIDLKKHKIFKSAHPSPLSASRGFFGSRVFSKINKELGECPIDWRTF